MLQIYDRKPETPITMYRKLNLIFALAAGLFGGLLSRYITPTAVLAQTQTSAPKEIQAQSFVLVDDKSTIVGTFKPSFTRGEPPAVVLLDRQGRELWRASGSLLRPLSQR